MKLFIVRHIFEKRVIGLFWCKNVSQLVWLVDEDADPSTAEYAVVEKLSVIRWGRHGPTVGVRVTYEEIEAQNPNSYYDRLGHGIGVYDGLFDFFGNEVPDSRWKRLPAIGLT